MQRVHEAGNADQQHDGREHLAHDDKTEIGFLAAEIHARHGIGGGNAADHSNERGTTGNQQGVDQIPQDAAVQRIREIAEDPAGRQDPEEMHIRCFRIAAEGSDEHHEEGIQDKQREQDHAEIKRNAQKCLFQRLTGAQDGGAYGDESRDHQQERACADGIFQGGQQGVQLVSGGSVEEEPVECRPETIQRSGIPAGLCQIHRAGKIQIEPVEDNGNQEKGSKGQDKGADSGSAVSGKRRQEGEQPGGCRENKNQDQQHRRGKPGTQQIPAAPVVGGIDGENDQGSGFIFAVDPFNDLFVNVAFHTLGAEGFKLELHFLTNGLVFFITHKGVGRTLDIQL